LTNSDQAPALLWFRRDLRLRDNAALEAAAQPGRPVIPVFIWAPEEEGPWAPGAASRWWLHQSLERFREALGEFGSKLIIRRGPAAQSILALAEEAGATAIYWNRLYEPATIARDQQLKKLARARGLVAESFPGNILFEPGTIRNNQGGPIRVFTAFWKACLKRPQPTAPKDAPRLIRAPREWPESLAISDLQLEPKIDWAAGLVEAWRPGETGARNRFQAFANDALEAYAEDRERPDHLGTSRLSPHLHFGEISAREVWHAAQKVSASEPFLRQIIWREFAQHLLFHYPHTPSQPLRPEFARFTWRMDERALKAWTRGKTGYPLVDAGLRELWRTGWMHNRVRMITASFLVKHLLIPWQEGAAWFWDTLVDADLANNTLGWQWVAGSGADAAPYFRIFNPVIQGERFDPAGDYVRRWVPELAALPAAWIHKPWQAPGALLLDAGVRIGTTYPEPIVIHEDARQRALEAFARMREQSKPATLHRSIVPD